MKTQIGRLLVRAGLITESQLARALKVQNIAGGRIGTHLVERGVLSEDDLGRTLALQRGCEYVPWDALSAVPPETVAVLPARLALKHEAVPYECGEGHVKVAMLDPDDLRALDELVFVAGRKVIANVALEVRIHQALEKYYGKLRAARYAVLGLKLSRLRKATESREPEPVPPSPPVFEGPAAATPAASEPSSKFPAVPAPAVWTPFLAALPEPEPPGEPEGIPWDETTGSRRSRPKPESSSPPPLPFEEIQAFEFAPAEPALEDPQTESPAPRAEESFDQVRAATGWDAVGEAILAALVGRFPNAAIFSSGSEGVAGWAAAGKDVNAAAVRSFSVSWKEPSVFLKARLARAFYVGPLPLFPRHGSLAAALGDRPGEGIVQPVFVGERPVAFLYACSASSGSFTPSDLAYIGELCGAASAALANAIRLRKGEI